MSYRGKDIADDLKYDAFVAIWECVKENYSENCATTVETQIQQLADAIIDSELMKLE